MERVSAVKSSGTRPVNLHQLVTLEDLVEFKRDLLISIHALLSKHIAHSPKKWLKTYEVKKMLDISSGTLQTLRSNGTMPYSKIGGIIYYDADDVNKVLESLKRDFRKSVKRQ